MSTLQKSKRFDPKDKFNDTSRYLDEIHLYSPLITLNLLSIWNPDIYSRELQLNKENTSDKETSFFDLNIKVIGSYIQTSVYDKRDDFGYPIINFPWLSGDVSRLPSYGICISQLVRFATCCTSVLKITSFGKRLGSSLGHTLNFCPNLVQYRFKDMYLKESLTRSSTVILSIN